MPAMRTQGGPLQWKELTLRRFQRQEQTTQEGLYYELWILKKGLKVKNKEIVLSLCATAVSLWKYHAKFWSLYF